MARSLPLIALTSILLVACSAANPSANPVAAPATVDPVTDPTIVGAIDEAVLEGEIQAEEALRTGRRAGRVAGVLAAVLGGPESESLDETLDRYRRTRDAVAVTTAAIGATKGAVEGAQRGYDFDVQFAELHEIEGLQVMRPYPDQIDAYIAASPNETMLASIAAVFAGREERAIEIEAAGEEAIGIRESLIRLGVPASSLTARRNDEVQGVSLRVQYRT